MIVSSKVFSQNNSIKNSYAFCHFTIPKDKSKSKTFQNLNFFARLIEVSTLFHKAKEAHIIAPMEVHEISLIIIHFSSRYFITHI